MKKKMYFAGKRGDYLSGEGLRRAAINGDLQEVVRYLDGGVDVDAFCHNAWTALHNASYHGRGEVVSYLIEKGADVNWKNNTGITPLHFACVRGHHDVVDRLLIGTASPMIRDNSGYTPYDYAQMNGHSKCVAILQYHQHRKNWLLFSYGITPHLHSDGPIKEKILLISDLNRYVTEFM